MTRSQHPRRSDLFLLRVWREEGNDGTSLHCGRLQVAVSGEQHQFRGLPGLVDLLNELLEGQRADAPIIPDPDTAR